MKLCYRRFDWANEDKAQESMRSRLSEDIPDIFFGAGEAYGKMNRILVAYAIDLNSPAYASFVVKNCETSFTFIVCAAKVFIEI